MTRRARRRRRLFTATLAAAALACVAVPRPGNAHKPVTSRYNFSKHVLPVLARRCLACHRPGGPGPMSLATYEEARPWAEALKDAVLERSMPPWYAEPGLVSLIGENALTARELDTIAEWASGGAPAGPPRSAGAQDPGSPAEPAAPVVESACEEKSIVLPEVEVGAPGRAVHSFQVPLEIESDGYLAGWSIEPGNGALLRAAALRIVPPAAAGAAAGEGMSFPAGTWTAGAPPFYWPSGAGLKVRRGSTLAIDLVHGKGFRSAGKDRRDRSTLQLRFLCGLPAREVQVAWLGPGPASLPPGAQAIACWPAEASTGTLLLRPGDAAPRALLEVFRADRAWPTAYRFAAPVSVSPEMRLELVPESGAPNPGRAALLYSVPRA